MLINKFSALLGGHLFKISKIAKETGISRNTLMSLYYRKGTGISFAVLEKLCAYLDCSVADILDYVPDAPPKEVTL